MQTRSDVIRVGPGMRNLRFVVTVLFVLMLLAFPARTARAAEPTVVGDGTPESCTLEALNQARADVPEGGTITFKCGPDPVTIWIADIEIYTDLTIDGGGLIIFTGGTGTGCAFCVLGEATVQFINFTVAGAYSACDGPIYNEATLTLRHVTVSGNTTDHGCDAGGIGNRGSLVVEDSLIVGNSAACQWDWCGAGGGIWNGGTLRVINSTISGNWTGASGGGIANDGTLILQNTTIANNTAQSGGGLTNSNSAIVLNSLLADNTDWSQQPSDCSGTLASQGYNLIGSTAGCAVTGDTTGNLLDVDPLLGPLQDNGGPTFTHALLSGSPAINAGNPATPGSGGTACEATDQRGVARPQDGRCDIGAVEVQPSLTVQIDVKPGDNTNTINLKSKGIIPVAILSSALFDATTVDPALVTFGPSEASSMKSSLTDVNSDGRIDLLLHFRTQQTGFRAGDTQACLTGQTRTGVLIQGCDTVRVLLASLPAGLVLWNKLGSDAEVLNSVSGPDLGFYMKGDCQRLDCDDDYAEVKGTPAYIPGVFGNALTLGPGPYFAGARAHNAVLRNADSYLSAEQGAVEMWFQGTAVQVPYAYGIYRLFDGLWGLGDGIGLWVEPLGMNGGPGRLMYAWNGSCNVYSSSDGQPGYEISAYDKTWIHVAAVWDRNGIAGTAETLRLYVNGSVVAATGCTDWPTEFSRSLDIGGGNDYQIDGKFAVDNLKVWNYAKTDFSDRFVEGFKQ